MDIIKCTTSDRKKLVEDLQKASLSSDKQDVFVKYLFDALSHYIRFDSAHLCVAELRGMNIMGLESFRYKLPSAMIDNYLRIADLDFVAPCLIRNANRLTKVIHSIDIIPNGDWDVYSHLPFYIQHCERFDVLNTVASAARFPNHRQKYMALYLFSAEPRRLFDKDEISCLEYVYPALFHIWLYRSGQICSETMAERLRMLEVIRPLRNSEKLLDLLKLVVREPAYTCKEYARELERQRGSPVSPKTISNQLDAIYEKLEINSVAVNKKCRLYKIAHFLADI